MYHAYSSSSFIFYSFFVIRGVSSSLNCMNLGDILKIWKFLYVFWVCLAKFSIAFTYPLSISENTNERIERPIKIGWKWSRFFEELTEEIIKYVIKRSEKYIFLKRDENEEYQRLIVVVRKTDVWRTLLQSHFCLFSCKRSHCLVRKRRGKK